MEPQTFTNITPVRFERLKAQAEAAGLHLGADSGQTAISHGIWTVHFDYAYDRAGNSLMIHCTSKPRLLAEHIILEEIETLITATA